MRGRIFAIFILLAILLVAPAGALAQTYYFQVDRETVQVFYNADGTASIDYVYEFTNSPSASKIDFVDVGVPNSNYDLSSVYADINGQPVVSIEKSPYVNPGVAVGLGSNSIMPGQKGTVHVFIGAVRDVLYFDDNDKNYASAVFSPNWFGSQYVYGHTALAVSFHLPPGIKPEEPRWHASPSGWASEPATNLDDQGRVLYTWSNANANAYSQYEFGASFPKQYVPDSAIVRPSIWQILGIDPEALMGFVFCGCIIGFIGLAIFLSYRSTEKRKLQYLPPKISIEGHGIKRGLTAVEAAILMEEPLDKIMTMILFGVIKKNAAMVTKREPLTLKIAETLPEELNQYEIDFLNAFRDEKDRRKDLQAMMLALVQSVSAKMKGFSRPETVAYYKDVINRAWAQVEAADTPEVKSQKYDEVMEWTMLDKHYDDRTRDVFRTGPVYVPVWWGHYDPTFRPSATSTSVPALGGSGGRVSLPNLPGADFAASVVTGVQTFSSNVVGNISEFTNGITQKTNPIPVSTTSSSSGRSSRGGGGGSSCVCACACACAGCACACAGGGR